MSSRFPTTSRPSQRLLVFARMPESGRVKTRLAGQLGREHTLALYRAMLDDVLGHAGFSSKELEVEILWTGSREVAGEEVLRLFGDRNIWMQCGATLGDRLVVAFAERVIFHQTSKIIAIGTDEPSLGRAVIDSALELLDSCDWVVGPAEDGGYYLIGCRSDAFDPAVFQEISWGTSTVFEQTMEKIRARRYTVALLPVRYDIDLIEDLKRYASENRPGAVGDLLREWGWP